MREISIVIGIETNTVRAVRQSARKSRRTMPVSNTPCQIELTPPSIVEWTYVPSSRTLRPQAAPRGSSVLRRSPPATEWLATNPPPYRLEQLVGLTRKRTLKLTEQDLSAALARINRATAFSASLPDLETSLGREVFHGRTDVPALSPVALKGSRVWTHLQSMMLTQSVFTPFDWVMFAETA